MPQDALTATIWSGISQKMDDQGDVLKEIRDELKVQNERDHIIEIELTRLATEAKTRNEYQDRAIREIRSLVYKVAGISAGVGGGAGVGAALGFA